MRLILMRHCKSSWANLDLRDHDRPLNKRGQASAMALGNWLRAHEYLPDQAIISSSQRTMETFEGLKLNCKSSYSRELYHASAEGMMEVLQSANAQVLLLIGHNPGIAEFASRIVKEPPSHERFHDYPTGATLVVDFEASVGWQKGNARDFVIPRALMEEWGE